MQVGVHASMEDADHRDCAFCAVPFSDVIDHDMRGAAFPSGGASEMKLAHL